MAQNNRRTEVALQLLVAVLVAVASGLGAQSGDWAAVDAIFKRWDSKSSPGCAVGIFKDGRIAYERGYGMADLENDVPITPATMFYIGSVSKQFTAAAAAVAMSHGVLSADDSIRKHLPELPAYADAITVRDLVHHTSGLRDYNTLLAIAGRRGDEAYDNPTVLRMIARQKALNFAPGSEHLYSNTGYALLATIVERAAKTPFAQFADTHLFKPLGMTETHFHTDSGRLVKRRANAYSVNGDGAVRLDTPQNERAGAGGVFTSVRELLHWDENFYTGTVGGRALIAQLETPGRLRDGTTLRYAWGLTIGNYRGARIVEHSGALNGYRAHLMRFPDQHTSFAALCNLAIGPGSLLRQAADHVLQKTFTVPRPAPSPAPQPAAPLAQSSGSTASVDVSVYAGTYLSDEIDATFRIEAAEGRLTLRRDADIRALPLQQLDDDTFRATGFRVRFMREGERVTGLLVDAGRVRDIRFERDRR